MSDDAQQNTDRELWRERPGDYYADSIHVTERGSIGIDCGGTVIVMPVRKWHAAQQRVAVLEAAIYTALQEIDAAKHVSIYSSKCDVCKATAKLRAALASTEPTE